MSILCIPEFTDLALESDHTDLGKKLFEIKSENSMTDDDMIVSFIQSMSEHISYQMVDCIKDIYATNTFRSIPAAKNNLTGFRFLEILKPIYGSCETVELFEEVVETGVPNPNLSLNMNFTAYIMWAGMNTTNSFVTHMLFFLHQGDELLKVIENSILDETHNDVRHAIDLLKNIRSTAISNYLKVDYDSDDEGITSKDNQEYYQEWELFTKRLDEQFYRIVDISKNGSKQELRYLVRLYSECRIGTFEETDASVKNLFKLYN